MNPRVLSRAQQILGIGELAHNLNRSRLLVHLTVGEDDLAGMRVGAAVGESQLQWDS